VNAIISTLRQGIIDDVSSASTRRVLEIASRLCDEPAPVMVISTLNEQTAAARPQFELSADSTQVRDTKTSLIWTRDTIEGGRLSWEKAKEAAAAVRIGGHSDWRLPTIKELLTLVDYDRSESPAIDPTFKCEAAWYWTSTPVASSPGGCAWLVGFDYGSAFWGDQGGSGFVRAVRVGQF
jgi:hypothetical protein